MILNSSHHHTDFTMPGHPYGPAFEPIVNTAEPSGEPGPHARIAPSGAVVTVPARSVLLFRTVALPNIERRRSKRH